MNQTPDTLIIIDEGTVNVELTDEPMAEPYIITFTAQGQCQPEVDFRRREQGLEVRHLKSCHGSGRNEGTVFVLRLSSTNSFVLRLQAGRLNLSGQPGLATYGKFIAEVSVGKIQNLRKDLAVTVQRHMLVGARANFAQSESRPRFVATVNYGEINIR